MSLRLTRSGGAPVGAALAMALTVAAVMLALFPAVADAQTEDKRSPSVEVRPGDSLWSISADLLGPNATPRRILNGIERIRALNRTRIGADTDLVLVGQELLVPPAMSERPAVAPPAPKTAEAADAGQGGRGARDTTIKAPSTAPVGGDAADIRDPETEADRKPERPPLLLDAAEAAPVPAVRAAPNGAQPSSASSFFGAMKEAFIEVSASVRIEGRRLLGLGIIVFTLAVAALMAWTLPMKRTIRADAELWRLSSRPYHASYGETPAAFRTSPVALHPDSLGGSLKDPGVGDSRLTTPGAQGPGRHALLAGRAGSAAASNGLALGVHNPRVRLTALRARGPVTARDPRLQRGVSFGLETRS